MHYYRHHYLITTGHLSGWVYLVTSLAGLHVPEMLFAVFFWLGYCNSALNPIIYTIFNRDFRRAFHKILCTRSIVRYWITSHGYAKKNIRRMHSENAYLRRGCINFFVLFAGWDHFIRRSFALSANIEKSSLLLFLTRMPIRITSDILPLLIFNIP